MLEDRRLLAFAAAAEFLAGNRPFSVAVEDFNGDGQADLVTANDGANNVSVLLGNGNGTFGAATKFVVVPARQSPFSVTAGDVDGDGKADIVTANLRSSTLTVLPGNGDGSFGVASTYAMVSGPHSVALGDFNRDGKTDLVTANGFSNSVSVFLGTGSGTFGAPTSFAAGSQPISVAVGDFNGDGTPDLATANSLSNNLSVLLGTGSGTFGAATNFVVGDQPGSVSVGDFNRDGKSDLVAANYLSGHVSVLLGTGTGMFGAALHYAVGAYPTSITVGDFNGDGRHDVVTTGGSDTASVLLGTGTGTFGEATSYAVGSYPSSLAAGDFNGDGKPDLVTAGGVSNVSVLLNTYPAVSSLPFSSPAISLPEGGGSDGDPFAVTMGDFNGDGNPDLVSTDSSANRMRVLLGNGNGSFELARYFAAGANPYGVAVGDFNRDGKLDLAAASNGSHSVSVALANGDGTFGGYPATLFPVGLAPKGVVVGDFNGDGKPDLATANSGPDTVSVLLGNGDGTFSAATDIAAGSHPYYLAVGDFNSDGKPDLVVANRASASVSVLLGNGDGTFGPVTSFAVGGYSMSVSVGDLNDDGKADLVTANPGNASVSVLLGNGNGTFGAATSFAVGGYARSVIVGDFNGDGKADLATANSNRSGSVSVLVGNGDGTFPSQMKFAVDGTPYSVTAGDFNRDGKLDLATVSRNSSNPAVSVLLGGASLPTAPVDADPAVNSVTQGALAGTPVGVTAYSINLYGVTVTYTLTDDAGGRFAINPFTGVVTVANGALLNTAPAGSHSITVQASDYTGATSTAIFSIYVTDDDTAGPTVVFGGSWGTQTDLANQVFTWTASDPSGISSVSVVVNRDGSTIYTSTAVSGAFNFDAYGPGTYGLVVTATDADNDRPGDTATTLVAIPPVIVTTAGASGGIGNDVIRVRASNPALPAGEARAFSVTRGRRGSVETLLAVFPPNTPIIVNGNGGNDVITVVGNLTRGVRFYGGPGHDKLTGGRGHDVLVGGAGRDTLTGNLGNDVLIGGDGPDMLRGGLATGTPSATRDENLLIGDSTAYDTNDDAMAALHAEWWNTAKSPALRIGALRAGVAFLGGSVQLIANSTITNDNAVDQMVGTNAFTWFWNVSATSSPTRDRILGRPRSVVVN